MPDSDIRILEIEPLYLEEHARTPLKFGAVVQDGITFCHVRARVANRRGQIADGWGAIFLSDFWAFPDPAIPHEVRDAAMRRVVELFCARLRTFGGFGHPLDIFMEVEGDLAGLGRQASREAGLPVELPYLASLVCASPADAALHDAFGLANGIPSYAGLGPDHMGHDLSAHLGPAFRGRYLSDFVRVDPAPEVPVFHLVGGLDTLLAVDVPPQAPADGRPNSLDAWIERDGLFCLKVKLRGTDLAWDLDRMIEVYRIAREVQARRGEARLYLSADTNEQCASPDYMVELLHELRAAAPAAYDALLYVEQPTERDLREHRFAMRELSALKPVILDESLTGFAEMDLALDLGWSGVALKTCKCHSMALLTAARATAAGIPYTIQDLTNPGLALLHSVGLAAHLSPLLGVEANSRQFYPATSAPEAAVHPAVVDIRDGVARTATLAGPGLGYQASRINRPFFCRDL
jgi:L-alanine-DL-glutamate epimerase-like enolase superfamily enzyme